MGLIKRVLDETKIAVENLFAGLKKNVEKMFRKTTLPIDPLPQMSQLQCFVQLSKDCI
jgi:hypothetical protein